MSCVIGENGEVRSLPVEEDSPPRAPHYPQPLTEAGNPAPVIADAIERAFWSSFKVTHEGEYK